MVAVDITPQVNWNSIARKASLGKPTSDYRMTGDAAPATQTITFLYTKSTGAITVDYAST
ncbi:MAG: hypothetical protein WC054_12180 [Candidatus Nanopelagicales bacterium]